MWREVKRRGPGEQPPGRVALRIVHPVAGDVALYRCGQLEAIPGLCGYGDTVTYRERKPATAPGKNRAYLLPNGKGPHLRTGPVITEHGTAGQIDEQQRLGLLIPMRRLTHIRMEIGKDLDTHTRRASHPSPCRGSEPSMCPMRAPSAFQDPIPAASDRRR